MIRFHLDQHISSAIALGLRARGVDVTTTADARLQDADDAEQIAFALGEGRVIFTHDDDFTVMHQQGIRHAGIVYSKMGKHGIGAAIRFLELMSQCLELDDMVDQIEYF